MNTKFSPKQRILMWCIAFLLVFPWWWRYLKLNTYSKLVVSLIFALILIVVWILVIILVADYKKEKWEDNKEINPDSDNVKNVVINHNYEKVNQKYQWWFSKYENIKKDTKNTKFIKVSMNDEFRVMQRLRELENCSFEEFIEKLFKFRGYVIHKPHNYFWKMPQVDWWKDLIIEKDNQIYVVQIKKHMDNCVYVSLTNVEALKWVLVGNEKWIFVTASVFSEYAKKFCDENNIKCVDYKGIWNVIKELSWEDRKKLENFINDPKNIQTDFKWKPKTCKLCWAPMKWRKNLWKWRYGCLRYPECKCTEFLQ